MRTRIVPRFKEEEVSVLGEVSVRKCIVSGTSFPKDKMIRFVLSPSNFLTPDIESKLPGKGYWLYARRDIVEEGFLSKRYFTKVAHKDVFIPEGLITRVEDLLIRRCKDLLGIGRKSGKVVIGFEKVSLALSRGRIQTILFATDGSEMSLKKIKDIPIGVKVIRGMTSEEQGEVFGRANIVFVGLYPSKITDMLEVELERLRLFRGISL